MRARVFVEALLVLVFTTYLSAQQLDVWHDPSPHRVQFVTVDENVKLEVLDWGGTGRPLVLLAGLGNTSHVFDDFARRLTPRYHVYGITRRGNGASSSPLTGYDSDRLGDDVLAVLDALKLQLPILVGHSIAGEELSSVASRHPERIGGVIYLDAAYAWAFYDRSTGDLRVDSNQFRRDLVLLERDSATQKRAVNDLLGDDLPTLEKDLQRRRVELAATAGGSPVSTADAQIKTFSDLRAANIRLDGFSTPEAEQRQHLEQTPGGLIAKPLANPNVRQLIRDGERKYTSIPVPALAIFAISDISETTATTQQAKAFQTAVPSSHVIVLPHANHYVFLSNEGDVLREMQTFLDSIG